MGVRVTTGPQRPVAGQYIRKCPDVKFVFLVITGCISLWGGNRHSSKLCAWLVIALAGPQSGGLTRTVVRSELAPRIHVDPFLSCSESVVYWTHLSCVKMNDCRGCLAADPPMDKSTGYDSASANRAGRPVSARFNGPVICSAWRSIARRRRAPQVGDFHGFYLRPVYHNPHPSIRPEPRSGPLRVRVSSLPSLPVPAALGQNGKLFLNRP